MTTIEAKRKELENDKFYCETNEEQDYTAGKLSGFNLGVEMGILEGEIKARKEFLEWLIKLDKLIDEEIGDIVERMEVNMISKKIKELKQKLDEDKT